MTGDTDREQVFWSVVCHFTVDVVNVMLPRALHLSADAALKVIAFTNHIFQKATEFLGIRNKTSAAPPAPRFFTAMSKRVFQFGFRLVLLAEEMIFFSDFACRQFLSRLGRRVATKIGMIFTKLASVRSWLTIKMIAWTGTQQRSLGSIFRSSKASHDAGNGLGAFGRHKSFSFFRNLPCNLDGFAHMFSETRTLPTGLCRLDNSLFMARTLPHGLKFFTHLFTMARTAPYRFSRTRMAKTRLIPPAEKCVTILTFFCLHFNWYYNRLNTCCQYNYAINL